MAFFRLLKSCSTVNILRNGYQSEFSFHFPCLRGNSYSLNFILFRKHSFFNNSLHLGQFRSTYATLADTNSYFKRKHVIETLNSDIEMQPENKLFAVVHLAGRQHKITVNDLVVVNSLQADLGSQIYINKVLLVGSENFTLIGRPILSENTVSVMATVVEHTRLKKVIVFKKKRRKNYKRTKGHRQDVTVLRINCVTVTPNVS